MRVRASGRPVSVRTKKKKKTGSGGARGVLACVRACANPWCVRARARPTDDDGTGDRRIPISSAPHRTYRAGRSTATTTVRQRVRRRALRDRSPRSPARIVRRQRDNVVNYRSSFSPTPPCRARPVTDYSPPVVPPRPLTSRREGAHGMTTTDGHDTKTSTDR